MTDRSRLDPLSPYLSALRERYPSPEAIFNSARRRRRLQRGAAGLALAAVVCLGIGMDPAYRTQEFRTAIGQAQTWTLADGSRLSLNTASELRVEWHLRSRRLLLRRGEALFDVAPSSFRRFEVRAAGALIEDIGTVFSVRADAQQLSVQVLEGAVKVHGQQAAVRHEPGPDSAVIDLASAVEEAGILVQTGQRVDIGRSGSTRPQPLGKYALAWSRGRLVFDGVPLAQAVTELQRYRRESIRLAGHDVGELRISAQIDIDNVESMLRLLPDILPVEVAQAPDGSVDIALRR